MPMSLMTFDALVDAFFDKCKETYKTKGRDNIKQSPNQLENFERLGRRRGVSPLQIIAVYQDQHRGIIDSYIINGELQSSEPLEMRFVDEINYALLMIAQAIAEGYAPAEDWLKAALAATTNTTAPGESLCLPPDGTPPIHVVDAPGGRQACCNPDGDECCDAEDND